MLVENLGEEDLGAGTQDYGASVVLRTPTKST